MSAAETVFQSEVLGLEVRKRPAQLCEFRLGPVDFDACDIGKVLHFSQQRTDASLNFQHYSNTKVDKLLDAGAVETDMAKRKQDYAQAATQVADDASYVYLYNPNVVQGWSKDLQGYEPRADRAIRFRSASLAG